MNEQTQNLPQSIQTNNAYPVTFEVQYPETSSRLLALVAIPWFFVKIMLLLPHIIVLYFLQIIAMIAAWIAYWAILFTGRYPRGLFDFVVVQQGPSSQAWGREVLIEYGEKISLSRYFPDWKWIISVIAPLKRFTNKT